MCILITSIYLTKTQTFCLNQVFIFHVFCWHFASISWFLSSTKGKFTIVFSYVDISMFNRKFYCKSILVFIQIYHIIEVVLNSCRQKYLRNLFTLIKTE